MTFSKTMVWAGAAFFLGVVTLAAGKEEKKEAESFVLPKPGPEHEGLKIEEGVWDATIEMKETPESAPVVSRGLETNTMTCGGLWILYNFTGQLGPGLFQGHGVIGYDPVKKKYVGTWVDSMSTSISPLEGTYDKDLKTLTFLSEVRDPAGKLEKRKSVTELKDRDLRVWTAYFKDSAGKEFPWLRITYKRRK